MDKAKQFKTCCCFFKHQGGDMKRILLMAAMLVICYPAICFAQLCTTKEGTLSFRSIETINQLLGGRITTNQSYELLAAGEIIPLKKGMKVLILEGPSLWRAGVKGRIAGSDIELWFYERDLDCR